LSKNTEHLYYVSTHGFEAACQIPILAEHHPASRLHGHSYQANVRIPSQELDIYVLDDQFKQVVDSLNYSYLNEHIKIPTDENIARWLLKQSQLPIVDRVGIQSTLNSGVDLDCNGEAHIWRRYRFEAAHQLPNVPAGHQCGRMHGHGFEVILHVNQSLHNADMGIDFDQLDAYWQPLYERLDYACLNDIPGLENPTSEVLANWLWQQLHPQLPALSWVTVYETHTSGCNYNGRQYRIWKEQRFESALQIAGLEPHNKRSRLHGHSYMIRLHLMAELDKVMGWTVDYGDVKQLFKPVYNRLDHCRLDTLDELPNAQLSELLYWIKSHIADALPQLDRIDLFEKPGLGGQLCWGKEGPAIPD